MEKSLNEGYLTATDIARYHVHFCQKYLWLSNNRRKSKALADISVATTSLDQARFKRGYKWEDRLRQHLETENLILHAPPQKITIEELYQLIINDPRSYFYIVDLSFDSPESFTKKALQNTGHAVAFGTFKPDFLEIHVGREKGHVREIKWRVIDAKASRKVKISHQVQIGFYWLALQDLFHAWIGKNPSCKTTITADESGVVWIPSSDDPNSPHPNGEFSLALLKPLLEEFLFTDIPTVLAQKLEDVRWHFNPLCRGCDFVERCRKEAEQGTLSKIPHLSISDHRFLLQVLEYRRQHIKPSENQDVSELEDLHRILHPNGPGGRIPLNDIRETLPGTYDRTRELLQLTGLSLTGPAESCDIAESTVLRSAIKGTVEFHNRRCMILPRLEDVAVYLSVAVDPGSEYLFGFSIIAITNSADELLFSEQGAWIDQDIDIAAQFIDRLAKLIKRLISLKDQCEGPFRVQFYVFDQTDHDTLVQLLVDQACRASSGNENQSENAALCIGALIDDSNVLLTTVQPEILASSILFNVNKSKLLVNDVKRYLRIFGGDDVDLKGTQKVLVSRLEEILKQSSQRHRNGADGGGLARLLPRVVVLHEVVKEMVSIPEAGFYGLWDCQRWLTNETRTDLTEEWLVRTYEAWKSGGDVISLLREHGNVLRSVVASLREGISAHCARSGKEISSVLPNIARDFTVVYINVCRDPHLKKLLFMCQFEMMTELQFLIQSRLNNTRTITLTFHKRSPTGDYEHLFQVHSGFQYLEADASWESFKWLLVRDQTDADLLFEDLQYFDKVAQRLSLRDEPVEVSENLCFANVQEVIYDEDGAGKVFVRLKLKLGKGFKLVGGTFRLRPRLVDFNTKKLVKALIDTDYEASTSQSQPLFLQMLGDINNIGQTRPLHAAEDAKSEDVLQRLYSEYIYGLRNTKERPLVFTRSQGRAFKSIIARNVTLIWGPPGHGKTHTLALSALRLLELTGRRTSSAQPYRILMTAYTNAAIENFINKLQALIAEVRALENIEKSEWRNEVEAFLLPKERSKMPQPKELAKYCVVAGTIWGLYAWMDEKKDLGEHFDALIVDEGSQMPVAEAAVAIRALQGRTTTSKRVIIAGDHLQLAPVLRGTYPQATNPSEPKLFGSILECLMRTEDGMAVSPYTAKGKEAFGPLTSMLSENFRMVKDLCLFTNTIYRNGTFEPQRSSQNPVTQLYSNADSVSLPSMDRGTKRLLQRISESSNPLVSLLLSPHTKTGTLDMLPFELHLQMEAKVVGSIVCGLRAAFEDARIFVVTPHRAQRAAIGRVLRDRGMDLEERGLLRVDTVERMQGDEADIVIACYGFTTHLSQLESELDFVFHRNRLNVALSRARNLCILIASHSVLEPPIAVLASPERREAFAHVKLFVERSNVVKWQVEMGADGVGGPVGDDTGNDVEEEKEKRDDEWEDGISDEEIVDMMGRMGVDK